MTNTTAETFVETGGIESVPASRRHGSPWHLLATWTAPNLEFSTIFVGVIGMAFFGLGFLQCLAALIVGNLIGSITQGILSTWGPREGLAQMVISRSAFGFLGNLIPAGMNAAVAGFGWFAVNSVSGAFALSSLTGMPVPLALLLVVVVEVALAYVGHRVMQQFMRYATYAFGVIFLVAIVIVFQHADLSVVVGDGSGFSIGGFTLTAGAAFGYAAGWNTYASDYSRYLPAAVSSVKVAVAAGVGNFISCTVLMAAGAASATIATNATTMPTDAFVSSMPPVVRDLTLIAIVVGAIASNALNIYSGAMSFLAMGVRIPFSMRRALVGIAFGVIGGLIALAALADAGATYSNFLYVVAYWVSPRVAVVLVDRWLRRGTQVGAIVTGPGYSNRAGVIAFVLGTGVSITLFSNQTVYVGFLTKEFPELGDLTAAAGFVIAAVIYYIAFKVLKPALGARRSAVLEGESDPEGELAFT